MVICVHQRQQRPCDEVEGWKKVVILLHQRNHQARQACEFLGSIVSHDLPSLRRKNIIHCLTPPPLARAGSQAVCIESFCNPIKPHAELAEGFHDCQDFRFTGVESIWFATFTPTVLCLHALTSTSQLCNDHTFLILG